MHRGYKSRPAENRAVFRYLSKGKASQTSEYFRRLCTGEFRIDSAPIGYKYAEFSKVFPGQYLLVSIQDNQREYTSLLEEDLFSQDFIENDEEKHEFGYVGLSSSDQKGEFYICFEDCAWMDGVTSCFGRIYPYDRDGEGFALLKMIETAMVNPVNKKGKIFISQCGQL